MNAIWGTESITKPILSPCRTAVDYFAARMMSRLQGKGSLAQRQAPQSCALRSVNLKEVCQDQKQDDHGTSQTSHSASSVKAERHESVCGFSHSHQRRRNAPCRTPGCNLSPALDFPQACDKGIVSHQAIIDALQAGNVAQAESILRAPIESHKCGAASGRRGLRPRRNSSRSPRFDL